MGLVLGTTLRLPGEMILESKEKDNLSPLSYAARLKDHFKSVCPVPTHPDYRSSQIHTDFSACPFVFVRVGSVRKPLQPPYDGPFKVLKRKPKYYDIDHNGNEDSVSIDRLKPAYIDLTDSISLANPNCSSTQHPSKASGSTTDQQPTRQSPYNTPAYLAKQSIKSSVDNKPLGEEYCDGHAYWYLLESLCTPPIKARMSQRPHYRTFWKDHICVRAKVRYPNNQYFESAL